MTRHLYKLLARLFELAPERLRTAISEETYTGVMAVQPIEYSFALERIISAGLGRGRKVLDLGCAYKENFLSPALAALGFEVFGIDIREFRFEHENFNFRIGDARALPFPDNFFDHVCAISTLQHIGVSGRYDISKDDPEGDVKALREIARVLRPGGSLLLTTIYGSSACIKGGHRIYDKSALKDLFPNWAVKEEKYYIRNKKGYWVAVSEQVASQAKEFPDEYARVLLELSPIKG